MTYTLELPENIERVLVAKARRRGVAVDALLLDLAAREAASEENAEAARRAAVKRGRGMFAGLGPTPLERRQWKDEELQRENGAASYAERGAAFISMLDKARPIIAAGILKPITSASVNSAIDAARSDDDRGEYIAGEYSNE